jgi:valyl-tRNA synthetase
MWNALKLVKMWEERQATGDLLTGQAGKPQAASFAVDWFENRLNQVKEEIEGSYKDFRLSEILKTIYSLIWDDFCSWYLEWVKPAYAKASADEAGFEESIDVNVYNKTVEFFEELMQLLHPFMPFVTEDIYHQLKERKEGDDLTVKQQSAISNWQKEILYVGEILKNDITAIRDARTKNKIKNNELIRFMGNGAAEIFYSRNPLAFTLLQKQTNLEYFPHKIGEDIVERSKNEILATSEGRTFFLLLEREVDKSSQRQELQKDLDYYIGFLTSVEKKLSNERFVQNAKPEVVEVERRKKADAEAKIKAIKESLSLIP